MVSLLRCDLVTVINAVAAVGSVVGIDSLMTTIVEVLRNQRSHGKLNGGRRLRQSQALNAGAGY
jgi:hypothetical protein